ncbi:MAG: non-ribosomal peptide synthetase [Panacagrimonas sp.]
MPRFDTLTAALYANLREDRQLLLIDGEEHQHRLSFARLAQRARGVLGALQRRGLVAGDAVILFVNDNERFLEMFWACVLGRMVPVPIAVGSADEQRRKLFRVFAQFDRAWVYTDARTLDRVDALGAAQEGLNEGDGGLTSRILLTGTLDAAGAPGRIVEASADDIAFIQYSSGSTSEPKGVMLTHRNLMANIASIIEAAEFTDHDVALSWMPLTHDMGLIGFHLNMLVAGVTHAIMRTDLFARRPLLWLAKATELHASVLCSPNFGYQHTLKQYEAKSPKGLDLSAVRLIFNGAEPISAELCARFLRTMSVHGLKPTSMFPVYGLAEASLAVTFPRPGEPMQTLHLDRSGFRVGEPVHEVSADHPQAAALVRLGRPVPGTRLKIADDSGQGLGEAVLGHVLIRGENVTRGYYRNERATGEALSADGWLDTGDLGFLIGGQLVIAGRTKDIIFVNGQNYYPHDLEGIAESVTGIETNKVVVVGARNATTGTEDLVVFALHRGTVEDFVPTARELRRTLHRQTGLEVAHVLPVPRIPKTTSGKLQRHLLARAYLQGEFDGAIAALGPLLAQASGAQDGVDASVGCTANRLKLVCDRLIPDQRVSLQTNLLDINLNSLTLARIHEAIDQEFPGRLEVADLFEYPTLEDLAGFLDSQVA